MLPNDCPFIIGGGLIRDAILGGRPKDIDVWLPTNITHIDLTAFLGRARHHFPEHNVTCVFEGPGAHLAPSTMNPWAGTDILGPDQHAYGDVNNNWVVEMTHPTLPDVNFMRSMTPWEGQAQPFFNSLMRAFDIDHCMFFVGYMAGQEDCNTVIMPQHMAQAVTSDRIVHGHMNEVYWNQYRMNITSQARIIERVRKMNSKYNLRISENMDTIRRIAVEDIIATPVLLKTLMRKVNVIRCFALPMYQNQMSPRLDAPRSELAQLGIAAINNVINRMA